MAQHIYLEPYKNGQFEHDVCLFKTMTDESVIPWRAQHPPSDVKTAIKQIEDMLTLKYIWIIVQTQAHHLDEQYCGYLSIRTSSIPEMGLNIQQQFQNNGIGRWAWIWRLNKLYSLGYSQAQTIIKVGNVRSEHLAQEFFFKRCGKPIITKEFGSYQIWTGPTYADVAQK